MPSAQQIVAVGTVYALGQEAPRSLSDANVQLYLAAKFQFEQHIETVWPNRLLEVAIQSDRVLYATANRLLPGRTTGLLMLRW